MLCSFAPDVSDAFVGYSGIDNGVRDRAMAHECLQSPRIDSARRQGVSSIVPQHVSMYLERHPSGLAKPLYELLGTIDGEGRLALRQEHEICMGMLAPQRPQQSQLVTLQAVDARRAIAPRD